MPFVYYYSFSFFLPFLYFIFFNLLTMIIIWGEVYQNWSIFIRDGPLMIWGGGSGREFAWSFFFPANRQLSFFFLQGCWVEFFPPPSSSWVFFPILPEPPPQIINGPSLMWLSVELVCVNTHSTDNLTSYHLLGYVNYKHTTWDFLSFNANHSTLWVWHFPLVLFNETFWFFHPAV